MGDIIPIQIRTGLIVHLHGIPHDFTPAEADRIARVVRAYAEGNHSLATATALELAAPLSDTP